MTARLLLPWYLMPAKSILCTKCERYLANPPSRRCDACDANRRAAPVALHRAANQRSYWDHKARAIVGCAETPSRPVAAP